MRRRTPAFTLVELMAAMAVLALLMVALVGMFDQAMRGWRNAQKGIEGRRESRTAIQMVQRDLQGILISANTPLYVQMSDGGRNWSPYFLTTLPVTAQATNAGGDVGGVGYRVEWDATANEGRGSYLLRRYQQEPVQQLARLQTALAGTLPPSLTTLFPTSGDGITVETLAQNVAHFHAEIFNWNGTFFNYVDLNEGGTSTITNRPGYFFVELGAYDPQTVRGFASQDDWSKPENVKKHVRTYLWRVVP
jgi:prepilin-type N-terminal cleavage/methylation domain-containing protein